MKQKLGWMTGFEPAAFWTTTRRSNQLSYTHHTPFSQSRRSNCGRGCSGRGMSMTSPIPVERASRAGTGKPERRW